MGKAGMLKEIRNLLISTVLAGLISLCGCESEADMKADILGDSVGILKWHPGSEQKPQPIVRVERFKYSDLGIGDLNGRLSEFAPFSSVIDTFVGKNEDLLKKFQSDFIKYMAPRPSLKTEPHTGKHPDCACSDDTNISLYTYLAPYEYDQTVFLKWLRDNTDKDDFIDPAGRKFNDYRGDLICPVVNSAGQVTEDFLKKTFGHGIIFENDSATLLIDNKYNPLRWMAPVNEVHHHEQPAAAMLMGSKQGQWERTAKICRNFLDGDYRQHIYLEYDVELEVEDFREQMNEYNIWDFHGGKPLGDINGIVAKTHYNTQFYSQSGQSACGRTLPTAIQKIITKWLKTRFVPPDIQVSIMTNWAHGKYRSAEFMIASKNQQRALYDPTEPNGVGVLATSSKELEPYIVDGGNSGNVAWTRFPVDLLKKDVFTRRNPELPVIVSGGEYVEIPDGGFKRNFHGVIDLTAFYVLSRAHKFFPVQRGYWVNEWLGFEGDNPQFRNPDEQHGVSSIGIIFENHGPFKVAAKVNKLNVYVVDKPAATGD